MLSTMSLNPSVEITFHIIKPKIIVLLFEKTKDKSQAAENRTLCEQKIRPKYIVELFSMEALSYPVESSSTVL